MLVVGSPEAELKFREYIQYGRTTIPLRYKGKVFQICRIDGNYVFIRIDGYNWDSGEMPDVISGSPDHIQSAAKGRKGFRISEKAVTDVSVSGRYTDFVTINGARLCLKANHGKREKLFCFEIMGSINEFILKDFFKDTGSEIRIFKNNAVSHEYSLSSILQHFNKICRRLDIIMTAIAVISGILLAIDFITVTPCNNILSGIGAMLPLVNFALFLRYSKLISFIVPSVQNKTKYVSKKSVGFYSKFVSPMVIGMFSAFGGLTLDIDVLRVFLIGGGLFTVMVLLMAVCMNKSRYRKSLIVGYAILMLTYPAHTVHFVNRMAVTQEISTYTAIVEKYRVNPDSEVDKSEFIGIVTSDGQPHEVPLGISENNSVEPGKTVMTVHEYRGLLGIQCADMIWE